MARKEDSKVTKRVGRRMELTTAGIFNFPARPKNIPWYLVHKFLFRGLGINRMEIWDGLLKKYVNDPKNGVPATPEHRTSSRGNITSQVFSEDEGMSINTFVKAAVVAGAEEIELLSVWKMPDGKRIVGKIKYPLNSDTIVNMNEDDKEAELISRIMARLKDKDGPKDLDEILDSLSKEES